MSSDTMLPEMKPCVICGALLLCKTCLTRRAVLQPRKKIPSQPLIPPPYDGSVIDTSTESQL